MNKPAKQLGPEDKFREKDKSVSRVTGLSNSLPPITTDNLSEGSICGEAEQHILNILCGSPGTPIVRHSPETLVRESIPKNFPLLSALEILIDNLDSLRKEFEQYQREVKLMEVELKRPPPLSGKSQEIAEAYAAFKTIYEKTFFRFLKRKELRSLKEELEKQREADAEDFRTNTETRIANYKSYINVLATKIAQYELRIKELVEEYLNLTAQLNSDMANFITETSIHTRILITKMQLG